MPLQLSRHPWTAIPSPQAHNAFQGHLQPIRDGLPAQCRDSRFERFARIYAFDNPSDTSSQPHTDRSQEEGMKDILRDTLYFLNYITLDDGEFVARPGTLKYKFLVWLYGEPDGEF
jgi:hypothetical protein